VTAPVFLVTLGELAAAPAPGDRLTLVGAEGRHAVSVRRLRVGEAVVLADGEGAGASGTVSAVAGKDRLEITVTRRLTEPAPEPRLTVVQALPKGDRGELAVETMTEAGVDAIVPWAAARCVTQWKGERGDRALAKWRSTAREAAKQARRLRLPQIADLMTTRQVAERLAGAAFAAVLHEEGGVPLATAPLPDRGEIVVVVGPEGGVAPEELAAFTAVGAGPHRLGPTVLRTSTAGVAATALLHARTGRWS
jgi:16S rRNA (uracil1498-N3)-methyltransferase